LQNNNVENEKKKKSKTSDPRQYLAHKKQQSIKNKK
jgi:hypothetical protein